MSEELRFSVSETHGLLFVNIYCGYSAEEVPEILVKLIGLLLRNERPVRTLAGEFPQYALMLKALDHLLIQYEIGRDIGICWDSASGNFLPINISPRRI